MRKKSLVITSAIVLVLAVIILAGPRMPKPVFSKDLPTITLTSAEVGPYVDGKEAAIPNIRPGNASQVIYADDSTRAQTDYCLLYLHGFSASPEEGSPTHINIGKAFGMNTYLPRLADHGLDATDALLHMTPDNLWGTAKEALVLAKALGKKVILMGTSTGGTLALKMAVDYPDDIEAVILYSPNVRIANKASVLLARPYGLQLGRLISGGKYRILKSDPKTDPYWNIKYRVEAVVYLQQLIEKTMKAEIFKKITQPVFIGYYYKDEENQDKQVSVSALLWMHENLGTPPDKKLKQAFPDAGDHVIGSDLINPNWMQVYTATADFLTTTVGLTPVKN